MEKKEKRCLASLCRRMRAHAATRSLSFLSCLSSVLPSLPFLFISCPCAIHRHIEINRPSGVTLCTHIHAHAGMHGRAAWPAGAWLAGLHQQAACHHPHVHPPFAPARPPCTTTSATTFAPLDCKLSTTRGQHRPPRGAGRWRQTRGTPGHAPGPPR